MLNLTFDGDSQDLASPHGAGGPYRWSVTPEGILVAGEPAVRRTKGAPSTMTRIVQTYSDIITEASELSGIDRRVVGAMIATESGGHPTAERYEPAIRDYSFGMAQTLTETAHSVYSRMAYHSPDILAARDSLGAPPAAGDWAAWRTYLFDPRRSVLLGALYLGIIEETLPPAGMGDPILLYAGYNAGSARTSRLNPWGLVTFGDALSHFAEWYGDACAVGGGT